MPWQQQHKKLVNISFILDVYQYFVQFVANKFHLFKNYVNGGEFDYENVFLSIKTTMSVWLGMGDGIVVWNTLISLMMWKLWSCLLGVLASSVASILCK